MYLATCTTLAGYLYTHHAHRVCGAGVEVLRDLVAGVGHAGVEEVRSDLSEHVLQDAATVVDEFHVGQAPDGEAATAESVEAVVASSTVHSVHSRQHQSACNTHRHT